MFAAMEKYRTLAQVLLGAVGLSFVGFGFVGLEGLGGKNYIAKIGDEVITRNDLDRAMRGEANADREQVFQRLLSQAYLFEGAKQLGIVISDEQIKQDIVDTPQFHNAQNQFDPQLFQNFLQSSGLSEQQFMDERRRELTFSALLATLNANISSDQQVQAFINQQLSPRMVRRAGLSVEDFASKVKVSDAELQKFYHANQGSYTLPQAVQFEYLRLTPQDLMKKQSVSEEEIQQELAQIGSAQQPKRSVAHIMIEVPSGASAEQKAKAKAQAEDIAQQAKANPKNFAQLAAQYSQDSGSKQKGGVLGSFSQNGDLKRMGGEAFEKTAFSLSEGGVSGVVESPSGFHILQVTQIEKIDSVAQKNTAENNVRNKKAQQAFVNMRDTMSELALNHPNELNTAAQALGLKVEKQETWFSRPEMVAQQLPTPVIEALFGEEVFNKKQVSEVIVVNGEAWLVRATQTRKEQLQDFASIKSKISEDYIRSESIRLANEYAKHTLQKLQAGEAVPLAWSTVETVIPSDLRTKLSPAAYQSFMQAMPKNGKAAYAIVEIAGRPELIEVQKLENLAGDQGFVSQVREFVTMAQRDALLESYLGKLRQSIPMKQGHETVRDE